MSFQSSQDLESDTARQVSRIHYRFRRTYFLLSGLGALFITILTFFPFLAAYDLFYALVLFLFCLFLKFRTARRINTIVVSPSSNLSVVWTLTRSLWIFDLWLLLIFITCAVPLTIFPVWVKMLVPLSYPMVIPILDEIWRDHKRQVAADRAAQTELNQLIETYQKDIKQ